MGLGSSKNKNIKSKIQIQNIEKRSIDYHCLNKIIQEKGYDVIKLHDESSSITIKLPESGKSITVKVCKEDYIKDSLTAWKEFNHVNIIPVLKTEKLTDFNEVLIYTISEKNNLIEKINSEVIKYDKKALATILFWITEITNGLMYLHKQGYAYMNMQESSIRMCNDGIIKIDDLNFLTPINARLKR